MAKIATIRDLIKTEITGTESKIDNRLNIGLQRGTAADFLAQSNKVGFQQTPVSLRKKIKESNLQLYLYFIFD